MMKYYLMAPGPSMIPERILLEMAKPIIHHRTRAFEKVLEQVRGHLKSLFQTQNEVVLFSSVGSGAMEASVTNCFSKGDEVAVIRSGKFGERWSEQAKKYGLKVIDIDVMWGKPVTVPEVKNVLENHKNLKGIFCQACETSTGVSHPIKELGALIHGYSGCLFIVDAITALGISEIRTDAWNLDIVVTGSQKALMLPPGLSMMSFSKKALQAAEKAELPRYYFDVLEEIESLKKNQTHFTPAISLIQGLKTSLEMMHEEGLSELFKRHSRLAQATREGVKAIGLKLFAEDAASDSVTAVIAPEGINSETLVKHLQEKYNFTIIGGQDKLKGQIFRLGHMGYCGDFDVIAMISALEMSLQDLGYKTFTLGAGVQRALQTLHQALKN